MKHITTQTCRAKFNFYKIQKKIKLKIVIIL